MATIDLKGPTEMTDFAKDVSELYADNSKIDSGEIEQLNKKYIDDFFYFEGAGEIDTEMEIAAVVFDINADGKADNRYLKNEYNSMNFNLKMNHCVYSKRFSNDFITMVQSEIGSMPLEQAAKSDKEKKEKDLADS